MFLLFRGTAEEVHKEYLQTKDRPDFQGVSQEYDYFHKEMALMNLLVPEFGDLNLIISELNASQ